MLVSPTQSTPVFSAYGIQVNGHDYGDLARRNELGLCVKSVARTRAKGDCARYPQQRPPHFSTRSSSHRSSVSGTAVEKVCARFLQAVDEAGVEDDEAQPSGISETGPLRVEVFIYVSRNSIDQNDRKFVSVLSSLRSIHPYVAITS